MADEWKWPAAQLGVQSLRWAMPFATAPRVPHVFQRRWST